ncbi:hypothetical protein Y032_0273g976 [Ancylostoma ceylanicum]|nr:hypothetical protein Y032_0273g976 [Ancylostoma ceylanicum]
MKLALLLVVFSAYGVVKIYPNGASVRDEDGDLTLYHRIYKRLMDLKEMIQNKLHLTLRGGAHPVDSSEHAQVHNLIDLQEELRYLEEVLHRAHAISHAEMQTVEALLRNVRSVDWKEEQQEATEKDNAIMRKGLNRVRI